MTVSLRMFGVVASICAMLIAGCAGSATEKSAGEHLDDAVVTTKVKTALVQADQVDAVDVNVDTHRGVVQLSGFVDTRTEAAEAERVAAGVAGVERVENRLELKPAEQE